MIAELLNRMQNVLTKYPAPTFDTNEIHASSICEWYVYLFIFTLQTYPLNTAIDGYFVFSILCY